MFHKIDSQLFFSKNDTEDIRLGDICKNSSNPSSISKTNNLTVLGYADDEGIQLNGGRKGAALGPNKIREFLYKLTPPYNRQDVSTFNIFDVGNINDQNTLKQKHLSAQAMALKAYLANSHVISLGGGHDYGYADAAAFIETHRQFSNIKPVILNFDAHLDVRPNTTTNHSGTPFYRLKNDFKNQFELIEIGLQKQCNSSAHWDWALKQNIHLYSLEQIENSDWKCLNENPVLKQLTKKTPVFISFDIDALQSSDAGGCSQSWPTGLALKNSLEFLSSIYKKAYCPGLGIYEVAPPFDSDHKTAKAAALLAYQFIFKDF